MKETEDVCSRKASDKSHADAKNACRLESTSLSDFFRRIEAYWMDAYGENIKIRIVSSPHVVMVSKTHSCPIGCETNSVAMGEYKLAGCAGLRCRVRITKEDNSSVYGESREYDIPGFNIGRGGDAGYNNECDVILFADDFPLWGPKVAEFLEARKKLWRIRVENENKAGALWVAVKKAQNSSPVVQELQEKLKAELAAIEKQVVAERDDLAPTSEYDVLSELAELGKVLEQHEPTKIPYWHSA